MNVYLAARYSRRLELCEYRKELEEAGHVVTSRWLNGSHQISADGMPLSESGEALVEGDAGGPGASALRMLFAKEDIQDVRACHLFIAFTDPPRTGGSRGDRNVELGLALAWGIPCAVIGPRENLFCWLPQVHQADSWQNAKERNMIPGMKA